MAARKAATGGMAAKKTPTAAKKTPANETSAPAAQPNPAKKTARKVGVTPKAQPSALTRERSPSTEKRLAAKAVTASRDAVGKSADAGTDRPAGFAEVVVRLRAILAKHEKSLVVKTDGPTGCYLVCKKPFQGKELFFGAVRSGKAYVSFHLFPLYMYPEIARSMSPALARRMQGKACFNFKHSDDRAIPELDALTARGFAAFKEKGLI